MQMAFQPVSSSGAERCCEKAGTPANAVQESDV